MGGTTCATGAECCSGTCDATSHQCTGIKQCSTDNQPCAVATDCCTLDCAGGICGTAQCISDNQACTAGGTPCCSGTCGAGGTCTPLNTTCKTAGNDCATDGDCCNKSCVSGKCASPSSISYCTQTGDICYADGDCCSAICQKAGGATAGVCAAVPGASCEVDGTLCSGCTGCCSSLCAPFGTSGSHICQPASGCHVTGDLCHVDSDCCGGDPTQAGAIPGAGLIKCVIQSGSPVGVCSDPNPNNCSAGENCSACVPEGDICHYKNNGGCSVNSVRNDCCDATGNKGQCKLDSLGIPRCYGLTSCVMAGGDCASSADCCDNAPCVPDGTGHLKCGTMCVQQGGVCTTTADCCTGIACTVPPGSLTGTCTNPNNPPPPPPPDGGAVDMAGTDMSQPPPPMCALYGQSCSTTVPCCNGTGATCLTPLPNATNCPANATNCTCYSVIF
jgi:hypothetical protein